MSDRRTPSPRTVVIAVVVGLVAIGAGAAWWFLVRSDPPPPLSVDDVVDADGDGTSADAGELELDGTWEVDPSGDSEAGLRIEEERFGGLPDNTAVGRTPEVTGTLTVADAEVTEARFEVDLSTIEFTDDPGIPVASRSEYLQTRALETDTFPTATFELTTPVDVSTLDDSTTSATVSGELTLRDVTQPVSFEVDVRRNGDGFVLGTATPVQVTLSDHGIEAPQISGVSEVADVGEFEFVVVLQPAS